MDGTPADEFQMNDDGIYIKAALTFVCLLLTFFSNCFRPAENKKPPFAGMNLYCFCTMLIIKNKMLIFFFNFFILTCRKSMLQICNFHINFYLLIFISSDL